MAASRRFLPRATLLAGALALGLVLIASSPARATIALTITEFTDATFTTSTGNGYTVSLATGPPSALTLLVNAAGAIQVGSTPGATIIGAGIAGLTIQSFTNSATGGASSQLVDNETDISATSPGPRYLQVTTTQDGYTIPAGPLVFTIDNSLNSNVSSDLSQSAFKSTLTTTTDSGTLGPITAGPGVLNNDVHGGPITVDHLDSTSFSFTQVANLTSAASSGGAEITVTGTSRVGAVPEPATIAMAFSGLPLLGFGLWVRRRSR